MRRTRQMKVIYIGGYGRSGSTLLDAMLDSHPAILGGGELEMLFTDLAEGGACTCGEPYLSCPLWGKVLTELEQSVSELDPNRLAPLLSHAESTLGRYAHPGSSRVSTGLFGRIWRELIQTAAECADVSFVVDSSKSSRGTSRRIIRLVRNAGLDVVVVHLIRDPRAVLYSERRRGNNDNIESGRRRLQSVGGVLRPLAGWAMANLAVTLTARRLRNLRVVRVHYEDLVREPAEALERVGAAVGVDLSELIDHLDRGGPIDPGHGVRGNRMRRSGPMTVRYDDEWVTESPRSARLLSLLIAPIAYPYGYDLLRWPAPALQPTGDPAR